MKTKVGLWLDHSRAVIVTVTDKVQPQVVLTVKAEQQRHHSATAPQRGRYEAQKVPADSSRQRIFTQHLNRYYDAIIAGIGAAEAIILFGPGEAKGELQKRLAVKKPGGGNVTVITAGKLTNRQIAAKVRRHFTS